MQHSSMAQGMDTGSTKELEPLMQSIYHIYHRFSFFLKHVRTKLNLKIKTHLDFKEKRLHKLQLCSEKW